MSTEIKTKATLTCPKCGLTQTVKMPTNACQHFYKCSGCAETLTPKAGDCCVFCSYADSKCPPKQMEELGTQGRDLPPQSGHFKEKV